MSLEVFKKPKSVVRKHKLKVLNEDTYAKEVEDIIQRDFFPDLDKLKAQNAYLEALENKDVDKLQELYRKYSAGKIPGSQRLPSPATFETPAAMTVTDDNCDSEIDTILKETVLKIPVAKTAPEENLDTYLARHTSEDNESFSELMEESEKRHKADHAWLYGGEEENDQKISERLALPSAQEQLCLGNGNSLDTWTYKTKNAIMYVPEVELTDAEKKQAILDKPVITHNQTRFTKNPYLNSTLLHTGNTKDKHKEKKIGVDGKEIIAPMTPDINNYKLLRTPSPTPGVDESPLMTWGEIEGTPFRLDGSDTPCNNPTPGTGFTIHDTPHRDKIGIQLAEKARKHHRDKKSKALLAAKSNLMSPSVRGNMDRLSSMSPAAQRLLSKRYKRDDALRSAYTPSRSSRDNTPFLTPHPSPYNTPHKHITSPFSTPGNTPSQSPSSRTPNTSATPKTPLNTSNLTDNLLNLPKRRSRATASDFF